MTHHYPDNQSSKNLDKVRRENVCAVCSRQLSEYLDMETHKVYIACSGQVHEGIARVHKPPREDYQSKIRRETELERDHGRTTATALAHIPKSGQLTQPEAEHILSLVYPGVPKEEIIRCAILCRDFGLHPLMKEVYIIPFGQGDKRTWATVLGINATRKMMSLRGTFSYRDNTPRIMTEEEQKSIFGEVDKVNIVAITKLRTREGEEAQGYGRWPKGKDPYGTDKGNTKANMAFIRSERNAFGRLFTDAIPPNVEIIDEAYADVPDMGKVDKATGEIKEEQQVVEGEFEEVPDEIPKSAPPIEEEVAVLAEKVKEKLEKDESPVTAQQVKELKVLMEKVGKTPTDIGKMMSQELKWVVPKTLQDLKKWQMTMLMDILNKALGE